MSEINLYEWWNWPNTHPTVFRGVHGLTYSCFAYDITEFHASFVEGKILIRRWSRRFRDATQISHVVGPNHVPECTWFMDREEACRWLSRRL